MTKKPLSKNKLAILEHLKEFLQDTGYVLVSSKMNASRVNFVPIEKVSQSDYPNSEWGFQKYMEGNYNDITDNSIKFFEFVTYLSEHKQDKLALIELNSKKTKGNHEFIYKTMSALKEYPDVLFEFVNQVSFLNQPKHLPILKSMLTSFNETQQKHLADHLTINIENKTHDEQYFLFKNLEPYIDNNIQYKERFNKLTHKMSIEDLFDSLIQDTKEYKTFVLTVLLDPLSKIQPDVLTPSIISSNIPNHFQSLSEATLGALKCERCYAKINTVGRDMFLTLEFQGAEPDSDKIPRFIYDYMELKLNQTGQEFLNFTASEQRSIFTKQLAEKLENNLAEPKNENISQKSFKI